MGSFDESLTDCSVDEGEDDSAANAHMIRRDRKQMWHKNAPRLLSLCIVTNQ